MLHGTFWGIFRDEQNRRWKESIHIILSNWWQLFTDSWPDIPQQVKDKIIYEEMVRSLNNHLCTKPIKTGEHVWFDKRD